MQQVVRLWKRQMPIRLLPDSEPRFSDQEYRAFCLDNADLRVERTAEGEIVVTPPAGGESDYRSNKVAAQLDLWAEKDGRGKAFGSSAQYILPDGSALSPDAAWVSDAALSRLSREQRKEFLRLCPEFVVEVISPTDRLKNAKEKMERWIANGAELAWLIHGDAETVYVYRPNRPPEVRKGLLKLAGEGPVRGFVLQLRSIWKGLG